VATEPASTEARQTMRVKVLSPARAAFDGEALEAGLPAFDGEWGILPNHAPLVAALATGCLRLKMPDGRGLAFAIRGGYAQVRDNVVTVLAPECLGPDELTAELVEAEAGKVKDGAGVAGQGSEPARQLAWARACRLALEQAPQRPKT